MAITKDDIVAGALFEIKNNTKLQDGPDLMILNEDCDYFGGGTGTLPPGTQLRIDCPLDNRIVQTGLTVAFTIIGDESRTIYTSFWSLFKPRVVKV